jgi:hypothetical protein
MVNEEVCRGIELLRDRIFLGWNKACNVVSQRGEDFLSSFASGE